MVAVTLKWVQGRPASLGALVQAFSKASLPGMLGAGWTGGYFVASLDWFFVS